MTRRLALGTVALTSALLVVLLVPLGITLGRQRQDRLISQALADANTIAAYVQSSMPAAGLAAPPVDVGVVAEAYARSTDARAVIVDAVGVALVDTHPPLGEPAEGRSFASRPEIGAALGGRVSTGVRRSTTLGTGLVFVAVPVGSAGAVSGAVRLTFTTEQLDARVRAQWSVLAAVGLGALGAATVVSWAYARWVTRPLAGVTAVAGRLGRGELESRAADSFGPPEVRDLARSLNHAAERLQGLVASQRDFSRHVSHQLRTPLTAVKIRLETLQARMGGHEGRDNADLDVALGEIDRLSGVIDQLLGLADISAAGPETAGSFDVAEFLADRYAAWEPLVDEHGLLLQLRVSGPCPAHATPQRLAQVIDNLLANAVDASPPGETIILSAAPQGAQVELHVIDHGPGLGHAGDRNKPKPLGGTGLGLVIATRLASADNGSLELRPAPGGGVDATVTLPAATSA